MKARKALAMAAIPLMLVSLLAACSNNSGNGNGGGSNTTTYGDMTQTGQSIYSANCARCHGASGEGGTGPKIISNANGKPAPIEDIICSIS